MRCESILAPDTYYLELGKSLAGFISSASYVKLKPLLISIDLNQKFNMHGLIFPFKETNDDIHKDI